MTAMQLNAIKIDIIEMLVGINNEKVLSEVLSLIRKSTDDDFERIPGLPYTHEERVASVRKSVVAARAGHVISQEELEKEVSSWR
jgi:hypothetical protein